MARYNEVLVGRFAQSVQKLFGIKGEVPVASLAGEIVISHSFQTGRENRFLENWRPFGGRNSIGPVAAQNSVVRFANPLGSNIIVVVESLIVAVTIATEIFFDQTPVAGVTTDLSAVVTPCCLDARFALPGTGQGGSALHISAANNVTAPGMVTWMDTNIPLNNVEFINHDEQQIPLLPGVMFQVRPVTNNLGLIVAARWRERFLEEQERA